MATLVYSGGTVGWGGAVLKLSSGTVVVILQDESSHSIVAYKDAGGTPTQLGSTQTTSAIHGTYPSESVSAAVDSSDVVHILSVSSDVNSSYRDVAYNTISGIDSTPTWGTWATVATYTDGQTSGGEGQQCHIRVDSNDYPRAVWLEDYKYKAAPYNQPYYSHNVGSGWITKERIPTSDTHDAQSGCGMELTSDDDVEVIWTDFGNSDYYYRRRNGSWGTQYLWTSDCNYVARNAVGRNGSDTVYRYGLYSGYIQENDSGTGIGTGSYRQVSTAVLGTYRWIVYITSDSKSVYISYNTGSGWTTSDELQDAGSDTFYSIVAAAGYRNNGFSDGEIGYLFELYSGGSGYVYYDEYSVGGPTTREISVSDTITVNDTVVDVVLDPLSPVNISTSDTITVSDTPTVEVEALELSVSDSLTVDDNIIGVEITSVSTPEINVSDTITVSDTPTVEVEALEVPEIDVNDSVGVSDTLVDILITSIADLEIDVSDSLNISDSAIIAPLILAIAKAESVGVSDTVVGVDIGGAETVVPIFTMHYVKLRRS